MFAELSLWPSGERVTGGFSGQINMASAAYKGIIVLWRSEVVHLSHQPAYEEAALRVVDKMRKIFAD